MGRKRSTTYIAVTPDEYELPLYVADNVEDMAEKFGLKPSSIYSAVSASNKTGARSGVKFVKIKEI